jgi:hypothetical protein
MHKERMHDWSHLEVVRHAKGRLPCVDGIKEHPCGSTHLRNECKLSTAAVRVTLANAIDDPEELPCTRQTCCVCTEFSRQRVDFVIEHIRRIIYSEAHQLHMERTQVQAEREARGSASRATRKINPIERRQRGELALCKKLALELGNSLNVAPTTEGVAAT